MVLKGNFNAVLVGIKKELKTRKADKTLYDFVTVSVLQNGSACEMRMMADLYDDVVKMDPFKSYKFVTDFNTDYKEYIVSGVLPEVHIPGAK